VRAVEQFLLPLADLHGVKFVLLGDLADGLDPAGRLDGDTGFEFGAEAPSGSLL
jgi:hypothetical protein